MGNRYHIPDATKEQVFAQSTILRQKDVADRFGVAPRTVRRIVKNAREKGKVSCPPLVDGRPRELSWQDISVRKPTFTWFSRC